jgi:hypothetical protein
VKFCLCVVNLAIDLSHLPHLPQIPAAATDPSCAGTSSANILIGIGCPHALPSCANLHSPAIPAPPPTISRGFFLWRLSDAGLGARRTAAIGRHPKPSTRADIAPTIRQVSFHRWDRKCRASKEGRMIQPGRRRLTSFETQDKLSRRRWPMSATVPEHKFF